MLYVVMRDQSFGKPVFVAASEAEAAAYLDEIAKAATADNQDTERENSLTLTCRARDGKGNYVMFQVCACKCSETLQKNFGNSP